MQKHLNTFIFIISILGVLLSAYLWWFQISGLLIPCTLDGCNNVLKSEYSKIFGVPMAVYGTFYFMGLAFLAFERFFIKHKLIELILLIAVFWGMIFVIYLRYLEFAVIGSICEWCWVIGGFVLLLFIAALFDKFKK
ncbi:hypothetical protein GF354_04575 [Candidatus Peregrinibacteria bacterium]|nr:hypothetical protein [Candidatus Peregrinibacteria bacterium]